MADDRPKYNIGSLHSLLDTAACLAGSLQGAKTVFDAQDHLSNEALRIKRLREIHDHFYKDFEELRANLERVDMVALSEMDGCEELYERIRKLAKTSRQFFCGRPAIKSLNMMLTTLPDILRDKDGSFGRAMDMARAANPPRPMLDFPTAITKIEGTRTRQRPAYLRDHEWLKWYEDELSETHKSPAKIRAKWNGFTQDERRRICPRLFDKIGDGSKGTMTVNKGIQTAKKERAKS